MTRYTSRCTVFSIATVLALALCAPIMPPAPTLPPTRLSCAAIGLDAPVVPVAWHVEQVDGEETMVWPVADSAASWHDTSARPGEGGNVVLTGHSDPGSGVFANLGALVAGDELVVYAGATEHRYVVTTITVVREDGATPARRRLSARWIGPSVGERVTLVTCWPSGETSHRLIVVAKPLREGEGWR